MKICVWVSIIAFVLAAVPAKSEETAKTEEPKKSAVPEDLAKRIEGAIKLLEDKDYEKFFETMIPPEQLALMKEQKSIKQAIKDAGEEKPALLLKLLKHVKSQQPVLSDEGKTATFALSSFTDKPKDMPDEVEFKKIDGVWYLK